MSAKSAMEQAAIPVKMDLCQQISLIQPLSEQEKSLMLDEAKKRLNSMISSLKPEDFMQALTSLEHLLPECRDLMDSIHRASSVEMKSVNAFRSLMAG